MAASKRISDNRTFDPAGLKERLAHFTSQAASEFPALKRLTRDRVLFLRDRVDTYNFDGTEAPRRRLPRHRHRLGEHEPHAHRRRRARHQGDLPPDAGAPDRDRARRAPGDRARGGGQGSHPRRRDDRLGPRAHRRADRRRYDRRRDHGAQDGRRVHRRRDDRKEGRHDLRDRGPGREVHQHRRRDRRRFHDERGVRGGDGLLPRGAGGKARREDRERVRRTRLFVASGRSASASAAPSTWSRTSRPT